MPGREYVVRQVHAEGKFLVAGRPGKPDQLRSALLTSFVGYDDADSEWLDLRDLNAAAREQDLVPLRAEAARLREAELRQIDTLHLSGFQEKLRLALRKGLGEMAGDVHVTVRWTMAPMTFARLFEPGLQFFARRSRRSSGSLARGCQTWTFSNTASFYHACFPRTRLALLGAEFANGDRRMLAVEAKMVGSGRLVYVLTKTKVFVPGTKPRVIPATAKDYTVTQEIEFGYSSTTTKMFVRGPRCALTAKAWSRATRKLQHW